MTAAEPVVTLDLPLPAALPAARGAAMLVLGVCRCRAAPVTGLRLLVGGAAQPVGAWGMPRPDVAEREGAWARRSGFWAVAELPARPPGTVAVEVEVALGGAAARARVPLAEVRLEPSAPPVAPRSDLIAVCMATYDPDPALFAVQVASLRAQSDDRWICVISDDGSSPERLAALEATVGGDSRFVVSRAGRRLGFYRNFERALRLAPPEAGLVALCDQDDRWHPDKLAVLRDALDGAVLAYSDQRLVDPQGRVLRETLWRGRRNNHTDVVSMLVANSVTGAAVLMRRELAELALPFPETPGLPFHDHWLGVLALTAGRVAYVDRPLYDYVQHPGAFFGGVTHGPDRIRRQIRPLHDARAAYFRGYLPRVVLARDALARCGARVEPSKRRALRQFAAAERSPWALASLAARGLRPLAGRDETLGAEWALARGAAWRPVAGLLARVPGGIPVDARMPDVLAFQQERLRRWRADV